VFINRLRFRDVKPLNRDIPEGGGSLSESAWKRLLLQGGNGSGKTTIFETIVTLWTFWEEWIEIGDRKAPPKHQLRHFLARTDLAAMEIGCMLPEKPMVWIGMGQSREWEELKKKHPDLSFGGLCRNGPRWRIELPDLAGTDLRSARLQTLLGRQAQLIAPGKPVSTSAGGSESGFVRGPRFDTEESVFSNIVYFPSEGRTIVDARRPRAELLDMIPFNWVARFDRKLDLDSVLLTVKAREPERFEECLRFVNMALEHRRKHITGFGENGRLVVEGEAESGRRYQHAVEELSSGEKQILLMIGFTIAFLRPGGILLLDEPDLHIHVSMVSQLMETLQLICEERDAQLIVASHSSLVWDWFDEEERIDLSGWREGRP
jgi:energy-coupling factor transporter ATP-binding protein EcfA2